MDQEQELAPGTALPQNSSARERRPRRELFRKTPYSRWHLCLTGAFPDAKRHPGWMSIEWRHSGASLADSFMPPASCRLRTGRHDESGQYYLLTTCCQDRARIFADPVAAVTASDCAQWLDREGRVTLLSVVVMPDHVHMVIGLRSVSLPAAMHAFKSYVAHAIRRRKIWQEGYHDRGIRDEAGLRSLVEYCLHNPVRAGLVGDFHDYPYWWCRWEV